MKVMQIIPHRNGSYQTDVARGIRETTTVQEFIAEEQTMHIHNRQTKNTKILCCFIKPGGCIAGYKAQETAVMSEGTAFHNTFVKEDRQYHCLKSLFEDRVQVNKRSVVN